MSSTVKSPDSFAIDEIAVELGRQDVIIVVPPIADPKCPILGPSLLLDECLRTKNKYCIFYANLIFAVMIGANLYERLSDCPLSCESEALFSTYAFGLQELGVVKGGDGKLNDVCGISSNEVNAIYSAIPRFVDLVAERICSSKPSIVGFSALNKQITSSLAIAKRIKQIDPGIITVIGGNTVTSPMGDALIDIAPMIDYVFSGEADEEFPRFCQEILDTRSLPASKIIKCKPVVSMDSVKTPDFEDYFGNCGLFSKKTCCPKTGRGSFPSSLHEDAGGAKNATVLSAVSILSI